MIKVEEWQVCNMKNAIKGMRNPLNSWENSDTFYSIGGCSIGDNDLQLAQKLVKAGTDHSKFMRMIMVSMDITAPLYWWKEFDTYKVGTVANSCSTMHTIHTKPFTLDDFSHDKLNWVALDRLRCLVTALETYRLFYNDTKDKKWWYTIIQSLPSSYNQKRTVLLNYQVLRNMYFARRNHKLDEWVNFCKEIEQLPYAKELICLESEEKK